MFGSSQNTEALHFTKIVYTIIHKLNVTGATGESWIDKSHSLVNGINVDDNAEYSNNQATHHVIFRNLNVYNIGTGGNNDCLKLSGVNYHIVKDCYFSACNSGDAIDHVG